LWSEGAASFEPYHLEGEACEKFLTLARQIQARLAESADGVELAHAGHHLYRSLFRLDAGDAAAEVVHTWFSGLARNNQVEQLEFLVDDPALVPWNILIDEVPQGENWQQFFGARFSLAAGRRVNALRPYPVLAAARKLLAIDANLADRLGDSQRARLQSFHDPDVVEKSLDGFAGKLRAAVPDILLVCARFEQGQLWLGPDSFSLADLLGWLQESRQPNPDPLVILLAAGRPSDQSAWRALLATATSSLSGVVANEVLFQQIEPVFDAGLNLLEQFGEGKQNLGEALRAVRASSRAGGLALTAFCPANVTIAGEGTAGAPDTGDVGLPRSPYHPFAAYDADDRPLFLGREDETIACAGLLDQAGTRMVVLHGGPAAGKTSFLQAGLIPYLEQESIGFRALRDRTAASTSVAERDYPILILRCTNDLIGQFADALTVFCAQPFTYTTPTGTELTVDLPKLLHQALGARPSVSTAIQPATTGTEIAASDAEGDADGDGAAPKAPRRDAKAAEESLPARELWIALRDYPELLGKLLDELTRSLPFELVIVVDQGEELITLTNSAQQRFRRQRALHMLLNLSEAAARCKVIFSTRAQYLAELINLLPDGRTPAAWRTYFLPLLSDNKMIDALLWPTTREEVPYSKEIPHNRYGFSFEEGLAEQIVTEAGDEAVAEMQSPLAILHAVGALLYEQQVLGKKETVLRAAHLKEFGGVKKALARYFDHTLDRLSMRSASRKVVRTLVAKLGEPHADGTISRDLVPASDLPGWFPKVTEPIEQIINTAAEEASLFEIQQLFIGGQTNLYVSLPQDSLAQFGRQIEEENRRSAHARTRVGDTLWVMIPLVFFFSALTFWVTRNFTSAAGQDSNRITADQVKEAMAVEQFRVRAMMRQPLYTGLLAQADRALQAGNALRARQLLLSQPALRSFNDAKKDSPLPDLRGFEWSYLWNQLHGERHRFAGHKSVVTGVAVSPDGKLAASASHDGTVRVWNLTRGEVVALLGDPKHLVPVQAVAFSPDGKTLASAGADKLVHLWDVQGLKTNYEEITTSKTLKGHTDEVTALAFGKEAGVLASGSADKTVIVWDVAAGKEKAVLKEHAAPVAALAFSEDGKTLASAGNESQVILWDAPAGKKLHTIKTPSRSVAALAFSSDGKTLASGGVDVKFGTEIGLIHLWDVGTQKPTREPIQHAAGVLGLAFSADGKSLASAGKDAIIELWNVTTGLEQQRWIGHLGWVSSLAFAKDGSSLVSGSYDSTVKAWDPALPAAGPEVIAAHADWVQALVLNHKSTLLASGARDGSVKLWDPITRKMLLELTHSGAVTSLAFSNHEKKTLLAVGTRDDKDHGEIKVYQLDKDAKQGYAAKEVHTLKRDRFKGVTSLAFFPLPAKADLLLSAGGKTVILWDTASGKEKDVYDQAHKEEVRCVAFSTDGNDFASAGRDRFACLYELGQKEPSVTGTLHLAPIESITLFPLAIIQSGVLVTVPCMITASADQTVRVWSYGRDQIGKMREDEFITFRSHVQPVTGVLHNSGLIVSSSDDRTIKLFRLYDEKFVPVGQELFTLTGHTAGVRAMAMALDQTFLASAGNDGSIRLWRAPPRRGEPRVEMKAEEK
jgi:WD40 repeat protein